MQLQDITENCWLHVMKLNSVLADFGLAIQG